MWDFPFLSQEQINVYHMHGYTAACVLPLTATCPRAPAVAAVFCTITRPFLSSALVSAKASFESESKKSFLARMYSAKVLW